MGLALAGYSGPATGFDLWMAFVDGGWLMFGGLWEYAGLTVARLNDIIHQPLRLPIISS